MAVLVNMFFTALFPMVDHFRNGWLYLLVWAAAPVVCCPRLLPRYYLVSTCFLKAQLD